MEINIKREIKRKVIDELNSRKPLFGKIDKYKQKDVLPGMPEDGGQAFMVFADGSIEWGLCVPEHSPNAWVGIDVKSGGYNKRSRTQYVVTTFVQLKEQPIGYVIAKDIK